ncbi:MAG TPA: condensation domain-containing protein, partial [Candidatus Deferrimicrobium sp.]|nr:condensation domain-containing protein [Candidatus Deferrimicrobium sp.]
MNEKIDDLDNIEDIFPLSDIQMGMIYESLIPGTASVYYNQAVIPFKDKNFDFERFKWAVSLLVDKHPMLRTGFNFEDSEEPVQVVYKKIPLDIEYHDLCRTEPSTREDYIKSCLQREREKFFDIAGSEPLWRIRIFQTTGENIYFTWINHHAIHDGWSFASFMTELNNTYLRLQTEPHFVPAQLKSTYKNFIIDQVIEKKNVKTVEFWKNELSAYKRFEIPGGVSESIGKSKKISIIKELGVPTLEKLVGISKKYNISLRHICFAAYVYTLYMVSYENDFVVGLVTHNRPECEDGDKIMGCFLNEVPVRLSIPAQLKWIDYIRLIDRKLIQLTGYNKLSLFEIARITGENTPGKNPFFDTIFNYTDFHIFNRMDRSLLAEIGTNGSKNISALSDSTQIETNTPLDFSVDISGVPLLTVSFFDAALTTEMVEKLCRYFMNIIQRFSADTGGVARKEDIMGCEEREKILYKFNQTTADFPRDKTIHQLFEEQVEKAPDRIALVGAGPRVCPAFSVQLTYRQLNEQSNHLAWVLQEKGVQADNIVGIQVERSLEMIIGLFGILKSGGAYLPIDPGYPQERIDYMLKDSNAKILINKSEIR